MIKFFRSIRRNLVAEGKTSNYLKYAIGEIALVVIGILIALQISNWNEDAKKNEAFSAVLEQIYNVMDRESETMMTSVILLQQQIAIIDTVLKNPKSIDPDILPIIIYYLETNPVDIKSEAAYQLSFLEFDPKNRTQSKISKRLSYYVNNDKYDVHEIQKKYLSALLQPLNLPIPELTFGLSAINDFENLDRKFFNRNQQELILKKITERSFQNALKSMRSQKENFVLKLETIIGEARDNVKLIKDYYPEAQFYYANVGIIGSATVKGWNDNLPMNLTNPDQGIWEGDFKLSEGHVKFRCGYNWADNWGGNSFPIGKPQYFGGNIPVNSGNYHVVLNLTDKSYQFISK